MNAGERLGKYFPVAKLFVATHHPADAVAAGSEDPVWARYFLGISRVSPTHRRSLWRARLGPLS